MTGITNWRRALALTALLALVWGGVAVAQLETGNLYGTVSDNEGAKLPGVTVTLSGVGADQVQVTDAAGNFRFLGLDPGNYKIEAALEGFTTVVYEKVNMRIGRNTTIELELSPAVEETITVTAESPLLDQRKIQQGTTVTALELEKIPTARDPWAVMSQTPQVQMDRINVGGNESGQQAVFVGSGAKSDQNVFLVDGINITDMTALGSSSTYYGFGQFEEMQFATGGTDVTMLAPGVQLNMVTKRGTNEWRGSARYFWTPGSLQSDSGFSNSDLIPGDNLDTNNLNAINDIYDYGAEVGGPLVKDKLWIWGSYDKDDIRNIVAGGQADNTILENYAGKINAQITQNNSFVWTWNKGDKQKFGRGAGPDRAPEATFDQTGPTPFYKLEDTHIFRSDFFLTGAWSEVKGGFAFDPKGGLDVDPYWDHDGVLKGSYAFLDNKRPSKEYKLNGSAFFNAGESSHELKFGGSYRKASTDSTFGVTGRQVWVYSAEVWGLDPADNIQAALVWRDLHVKIETEYDSYWAQDTMSWDRLTVNVGLRYDKQNGTNLPSAADGADLDPAVFGLANDLDYPGSDPGFAWEDISPRLGVTYALGEERNTLLRGSFSRFQTQLGTAPIQTINPVGFTFGVYYFADLNGNVQFEPDTEPFYFTFPYNFDPENPTAVQSLNQIDPGLNSEQTDEIILGVEHAFMPEFVGGLSLTLRKTDRVFEVHDLARDESGALVTITSGDYVLDRVVTGNNPDGSAYSVPVYDWRDGLSNVGAGILLNGTREQDYQALSATFTKRLSNRWMMRGHLSWTDWTWNIPSSFYAFDDPTNAVTDSNDTIYVEDDDGAPVAEQSGGSGNKGDVFLNSTWSFNVNGLYQVAPDKPWGFNVGWNVSGREGYPLPLFDNVTGRTAGSISVQTTSKPDSVRLDNVMSFDARLDKDFNVGDLRLTLSVDGFNLLNDGTVLQRDPQVDGSRAFFVDEVLSPRVFRVGLRIAFR